MPLTEVYLGLGGNIGETVSIIREAINRMQALSSVSNLRTSKFYSTSPVSSIPQNHFINAACHFFTSLTAYELLECLEEIEKILGKVPKSKEAPRVIDIDILLFGLEFHETETLQIPHPEWTQRLFVLIPLLDLTSCVAIPNPIRPEHPLQVDIAATIQSFPSHHPEKIQCLKYL